MRNQMQVVIELEDLVYEQIKTHGNISELHELINSGTPLPKGHGRLIDGDELESRMNIGYRIVRNAQTIIEADKAESEDKE